MRDALRILRAFVWFRWRTVMNGFRGTRRKDGLAAASRVLEIVAPVLLVVMLVPLALGLGVGGFFAGRALGSSEAWNTAVTVIARGIGLVMLIGVLIAPLIRASIGHGTQLDRLRLLPIRRRILHLSDAAQAIVDPWVAAWLPAFLGIGLGLLSTGRIGAAALAWTAGAVLVVTIGLVGTIVTYTATIVFRNRRRGEWVSLILFGALSLVGILPAFLGSLDDDPGSVGHVEFQAGKLTEFPVWLAPVPSEGYARVVHAIGESRTGAAASSLALVVGIAVAAFALSDLAHRRAAAQPEISGRKRGPSDLRIRGLLRLSGSLAAPAAIAWAQVRTTIRTLRGKLAVYLTPVLLLLLVHVMGRSFARTGDTELTRVLENVPSGPLIGAFGAMLALLSFQPVTFNLFGSDGDGLARFALSPSRARDLVLGKIAGNGLLVLGCVAVCQAVGVIAGGWGEPAAWFAVAMHVVASWLVISTAGALVSALLPRAADLSRAGKKGNPHPAAGLVAVVLTLAVQGPLAAAFSTAWLGGTGFAVAVAALWLAVALGLSALLAWAAAGVVRNRLEALLLRCREG